MVEGGLCQENGVFFRSNSQLIVEGVMPYLLHVIPVSDNTVLNGVLQREDTSFRLSLITYVGVFLAHANHDTLVTGTSNNGRKDGSWGIVPSESSFAHTGSIVNNKSLNFVVTHLMLFLKLCSPEMNRTQWGPH